MACLPPEYTLSLFHYTNFKSVIYLFLAENLLQCIIQTCGCGFPPITRISTLQPLHSLREGVVIDLCQPLLPLPAIATGQFFHTHVCGETMADHCITYHIILRCVQRVPCSFRRRLTTCLTCCEVLLDPPPHRTTNTFCPVSTPNIF